MASSPPSPKGGFDTSTPKLLKSAYEQTRLQLLYEFKCEAARIAELDGVIVSAIHDFYNAGQRDEEALVRYAVSRAMAEGVWTRSR